jgi:asparagine synthase (glutamine-hydrolysing)
MRSFVGLVQSARPVDERLLAHLGSRLRLPGSTEPAIRSDDACGVAAVSHLRGEAEALILSDNRVWIVADVRLDDRQGLATSLGLGTPPPDDRELVLRAWRRWRESCVEHLHGDFSFAIWDGDERRLFCARDRFGVRPFYYARIGDGLLFSDALEAILAHPDVPVESLDDGAVADYLVSGVPNDAEATIYAAVRRLAPATTLSCRPPGDAIVRRYWTLRPPTETIAARDVLPRFRHALQQAVGDRLTASSAMVFMSGGLDSTAIAAAAREAAPAVDLVAGTSVYRSRIPDVEEAFAVEAARSIGIPLRLFPLDAHTPLEPLKTGLWTPEPGPLVYAAATRAIYPIAAAHGPIALHGHPADALLVNDLIPSTKRLLRSLSFLRLTTALARYVAIRRRPPYFFARALFGKPHIAVHEPCSWLQQDFVARLSGRGNRDPVQAGGLRPAAVEALASPIWSSYFEWAHPLGTHAPVELAYPWCDERVIQVVLALEPIPWLVDKHVVREMLRGRVSETIRRRRKTSLRGDPWSMQLQPGQPAELRFAGAYVDGSRLAEALRATGSLSDRTLRAVVFDYWLGQLPARVRSLRQPS